MAIDAIQAEDGDALTIQRFTQGAPNVAQARFGHFQPIDAEGYPELLGGEPLQRADQPEQLTPSQPPWMTVKGEAACRARARIKAQKARSHAPSSSLGQSRRKVLISA